MTIFSSLYAKVNDLKNKVEQHSISPLYLGTLLDEFIHLIQSTCISSVKDDIPPATMDAVYQAVSNNHKGQTIWPASIEVSSATPLIDFHYNNSTDDYNARLIMYDRTALTMDGSDLNVRTKLWAAGGVESWGTGGPGCYFNGPMRGGNTYRQPHSASFVVVYRNNGDYRYGIGWDDNAKTVRIGACNNNGEWIGGDLTYDFKGTVKAKNITELEAQLQDCLSRIEALEA